MSMSYAGSLLTVAGPVGKRGPLSQKDSKSNRNIRSGGFLRETAMWRQLVSRTNNLLRQRTRIGRSTQTRLGLRTLCTSVSAPTTAPSTLHGFEVLKKDTVEEYNAVATLWKHQKTGCEVLSVQSDDENKVFGAVFRTPPKDSTGLPHILEHSVLCGSRKYPCKEPFVELIKGSMNTFLNAFTYPDRTCYPVASTNLKDFYNLMDVYLDAVFFPNITPLTLQQEGWHYELENAEDEMTYKGVVFNEMKGVYSQPEALMSRLEQQSLFPDNTYGVDSGGDPRVIPNLTFDDFKNFHETYYHPSNARIWVYGDDPEEDRLKKLDEYLSLFERKEVDSSIGSQTLFSSPKSVRGNYAVSPDSQDQSKPMISVNWLLSEEKFDEEEELLWGFLDHLMVGTAASPLRKALNDSGLGEAVIGGGLEDSLRQPVFSMGLKGVSSEDLPKVEELIMETLREIEGQGFTDEQIEASMNTIEFSLRENNTGSFPRGLSLMLRSVGGWIYDKDPIDCLRFEERLTQLKERLQSGEPIFQKLILDKLLNNNHRVTVILEPSATLEKETEEEEKQKLKSAREMMNQEKIKEIISATKFLKEKQETPDPPELLATVPSLSLEDVPEKCKLVPTDVSSSNGVTTLSHDLFTNGVLYADLLLELRSVPSELVPLLPLFCRSIKEMGTEQEDFVQFSQRIGRKTGGVSVSTFVSPLRPKEDGAKEDIKAYLVLRGKAMGAQSKDLVDIFRDILINAKLSDRERFRQMANETKAGMESAILGAGHRFAAARLDAMDSLSGWISENTRGFSYLQFIRKLCSDIEEDWEKVQSQLETIRQCILNRSNAYVNLTADEKLISRTKEYMDDLLLEIPEKELVLDSWNNIDLVPKSNEALVIPTQVNYIAKGANLYKAGYNLHGSSYVINKTLGTSWLWDRVRVSGGAYGGFSDFDSHSGMFTFLSYRDPNFAKTVDVYDGTSEFLRELDLDKDGLQKAIIGTIGDVDSYQLPDAKGYSALVRHLLNITDEERQERREQILGTTMKDFKAFADVIDTVKDSGVITAVASAEATRVANEELGESLSLINVF